MGLANEDVESKARIFLKAEISKFFDINIASQKKSYGRIHITTNYSRRGPSTYVTKTMQKTKFRYHVH